LEPISTGKRRSAVNATTHVHTRFGIVCGTEAVMVKAARAGHAFREIPLDEIRSVRQVVERHTGMGVGFLILASVFYPVLYHPVGFASATLLSLVGVLLMWGSPAVIITTKAGDSRRIKGAPWSFSEADRFVAALRDSLFAARFG